MNSPTQQKQTLGQELGFPIQQVAETSNDKGMSSGLLQPRKQAYSFDSNVPLEDLRPSDETSRGRVMVDHGTPFQYPMKELGISSSATSFVPPLVPTKLSLATMPEKTEGEAASGSEPIFHHPAAPFMHHQRSPFTKVVSPLLPQGIVTVHHPQPRPQTSISSDFSTQSPSVQPPRLVPLKLVSQNDNSSTPYDPSTMGNLMSSSPLVKSLDRLYGCEETFDDLEVMNPPDLGMELRIPLQKKHESRDTVLPMIKLMPRSTIRKTTPRKRLISHDTASCRYPMMDIEIFPPEIKLSPKSQRRVTVDETHTHPVVPGVSLAGTDLMFSTALNAGNVDTSVPFPRILKPLKPNQLKAPLIDPKIDDDSVMAQSTDFLTDDEGSNIQDDPENAIFRAVSVSNQSKNEKCGGVQDKLSIGKKPPILPLSALEHLTSSTSVESLLGMKHVQNAPTQDDLSKAVNQLETGAADDLMSIQLNPSMCSLAASSVDSAAGDLKRDLFTPSPTLEEGDNFRGLSPPPLLMPRM